MPRFSLTTHTTAPVEEVWKLLFDPTRFPEWWTGTERVRPDGAAAFTRWPTGYPDFPMPQQLDTDRAHGRVTVSCQVSDIEFVWQLAESRSGTAIDVTVDIPAAEADRFNAQQRDITESLHRLAALAETSTPPVGH